MDVVIREKKMTRQDGNDNLQKCVARHDGKGAKKVETRAAAIARNKVLCKSIKIRL